MDIKVVIRIRQVTEDNGFRVDDGNREVFFEKEHFTADFVFGEQIKQECLYNSLRESLFKSFYDEKNFSIITYGQSGSGKTYTLGANLNATNDSLGIIPRFLKDLFVKSKNSQFYAEMSFLEIHDEKIKDLFDNSNKNSHLTVAKTGSGDSTVNNLLTLKISDSESALNLFQAAIKKRETTSALKKIETSRSHVIFTIYFKNILNNTMFKFSFVDLAGSEKCTKISESNILTEATYINKGLFNLELVINKFSSGDNVSFKGSNLTKLLQGSFDGHSSTFFFACINPLDTLESLNTLKYATKFKKINNKKDSQLGKKSSGSIIIESHLSELLMLRAFKKEYESKKFRDMSCSPIKISTDNINDGNNLFYCNFKLGIYFDISFL